MKKIFNRIQKQKKKKKNEKKKLIIQIHNLFNLLHKNNL